MTHRKRKRDGFTRRQALKNGALGVASLTIAERLLALGGNNEALASLKPSLAKSGYGPLVHKDGAKLALPKGFKSVFFGRAGTPMSDGLPTPTCHDGTGYFSGGKDRVWIARNQEGFQLGQAHGPVNAYDPYRPGRRHRLALQHQDGPGSWQRPRPQRHRQQLQRRRDPVGDVADG